MTRGEYCALKKVKSFDIDLSLPLDSGFKELIDWICGLNKETIDSPDKEDFYDVIRH